MGINLDDEQLTESGGSEIVKDAGRDVIPSNSTWALEVLDRTKHLIFIIDMSGSMIWPPRKNVGDYQYYDRYNEPSRSDIVKRVASRIVTERFDKHGKEARISLYSFGSDVKSAASYVNQKEMLQAIQDLEPGGGTQFLPPLRRAVLDIGRAKRESSYHHIVFISDGQGLDNGLLVGFAEQELLPRGVVLDWVQIGHTYSDDINQIKKAVETTGGTFDMVTDAEGISTKLLEKSARLALPEPSKQIKEGQ